MKQISFLITALFLSIFAAACHSDEPVGAWEPMKWQHESITLKTEEKKTFTVPKEGRTFQFKCKNYNVLWFSDVTEKINNTTVRYDISSVNANLPKNDNKHIYGNFSASSIKDNILTVTINPNNSGVKRYIDVAVTAGDVFDNIYFEQE